MARHDPRVARALGLWTAAWLGVFLLGGLLWLGNVSLQWPVLLVPVVWALVALRPRRDTRRITVEPPDGRAHRTDTVQRPVLRPPDRRDGWRSSASGENVRPLSAARRMLSDVIHARGLARTFRKKKQEVHAVVGVDLDVEAGEIVGFLGPNGAGKTTTLRMLTTLLEPTAGTATVAGRDLIADPVGVRRRIGYVSQSGSTAPEARAGEEVVDHARLYGMSTAEATERGRRLFRELELDGLWDRQPTGLDPQARANLWTHIEALRAERGTTVFLTTHYLDEADALCDRILVIDHGAIVASGTPDELKSQVGGDVLTVTVQRQDQVGVVTRLIGELPGAEPPQVLEDRVVGRVAHGGAALVELVRRLDRAGIAVSGIESRRPSLDDVFLGLTGRSLRDSEAPAAAVGEGVTV